MNSQATDKSKVFEKGDKVHYVPMHARKEPLTKYNTANGIVRSVTDSGVFVVYHCGGKWDDYENYTSALTDPDDLRHGWLT